MIIDSEISQVEEKYRENKEFPEHGWTWRDESNGDELVFGLRSGGAFCALNAISWKVQETRNPSCVIFGTDDPEGLLGLVCEIGEGEMHLSHAAGTGSSPEGCPDFDSLEFDIVIRSERYGAP